LIGEINEDMKRMILLLLAVVFLGGCSFGGASNTDLALKCTELFENRKLSTYSTYNIDLYVNEENYFITERVYFDDKYEACIYKKSHMQIIFNYEANEEDGYYVVEYHDLEKDLYILGTSGFELSDPEFTREKERLFELI
jgi:hypothetical protein